MKLFARSSCSLAATAALLLPTREVFAQDNPTPPPAAAVAAAPEPAPAPQSLSTPDQPSRLPAESVAPAPGDAVPMPLGGRSDVVVRRRVFRGNGNQIFSVGQDSYLAVGSQADAVVSIFGSSTADGEVSASVVSIFGSSRTTGRVGRAVVSVFGSSHSAGETVGDAVVSLLGNTEVNSQIGGQAVAVLGDVTLGPKADIGGNVVAIGGRVIRQPGSIIHGQVQNITFPGDGHFEWLQAWTTDCLAYARPLALGRGLGLTWSLTFGVLVLYLLLALLCRGGLEKCTRTLETRPVSSLFATLLALLLTPLLTVLLIPTVVGIPFLWAGLLFAVLFGKAVLLAWIGGRVTRCFGDGPLSHPAVAVLIGGVMVTVLYLVPVLGFLVFALLSWLGLGVVVRTLMLGLRREKPAIPPPAPAAMMAVPAIAGTAPADLGVTAAVGGPAMAPAPAFSSLTLPRAGFWIRLAALLIDAILVFFIANLLRTRGNSALLLLAVYAAAMWRLRGTTIGGIICGLKVVRLDDRPLDWTTAVVRTLGCFLSAVVAGLGFFWVAIDGEKQSWHDKVAGTTVVRVPKGVSLV